MNFLWVKPPTTTSKDDKRQRVLAAGKVVPINKCLAQSIFIVYAILFHFFSTLSFLSTLRPRSLLTPFSHCLLARRSTSCSRQLQILARRSTSCSLETTLGTILVAFIHKVWSQQTKPSTINLASSFLIHRDATGTIYIYVKSSPPKAPKHSVQGHSDSDQRL